ncbi:MAG: hypothetical protein M1833_003835 [Piccolia ochrophora]|nr:MAG: hypothetical protein M1833_003835 [Piccolia ochrophora]
MAVAAAAVPVYPNRALGSLVLGASLQSTLSRLKAQPQLYPDIDLLYSRSEPLRVPVVLSLPKNGLRLRFDGPDQRLRLVEVVDFSKCRLSYKSTDIVRPVAQSSGLANVQVGAGPTFRHVYHRLFGPTFPGEYIPPASSDEGTRGTYVLSYPGIAFSFPLRSSSWSSEVDFVSLLSSTAASPAVSLAIFHGSSWSDARPTLFTQPLLSPRLPYYTGPDEIELARVFRDGRIELVRRTTRPFWIVLGETTPQDLVAELGPPDAIYRKMDRRLSIHRSRASDAGRDLDPNVLLSSNSNSNGTAQEDDGNVRSSIGASDDEDSSDVGDARNIFTAESFYNYFSHGFDILISTSTSASVRTHTTHQGELSTTENMAETYQGSTATDRVTATKILLHGNVPGSYSFNRHRRSRWSLELGSSAKRVESLNSEMPFGDISKCMKDIYKHTYKNEEHERSSQRGMVLNRGWGDSPGSSCELLGGWEENAGDKRLDATSFGVDVEQGLGNTELFGFPGLIFEVLKNDSVSCLTVF